MAQSRVLIWRVKSSWAPLKNSLALELAIRLDLKVRVLEKCILRLFSTLDMAGSRHRRGAYATFGRRIEDVYLLEDVTILHLV